MKLGLVQQANSSDRAANIEKLKQNIRACALQGAELVVLQELHNGLYFCQTENTEVFDQAEPIPSGYCIVTQCSEPCCLINGKQLIPIISRSGKACCKAFFASSSFGDL